MKWKRIALIGNPNCGKSTLFNRLTGLSQKTSNLPGTTVDSFEGKLHNTETTLVDLPGIYSLFTNTDYEKVVVKNLLGINTLAPEALFFILDASNLRRNLLLLSQVAELGIPTAGILTMHDTALRRNIEIDIQELSSQLGIPIITFNPRKDKDISPVLNLKPFVGQKIQNTPNFTDRLKSFIQGTQPEGISAETLLRYNQIDGIIKKSVKRKTKFSTVNTLKIDKVLTHPITGIMAFILVMLALFQSVFMLAEFPMQGIEWAFSTIRSQIDQWLPTTTTLGNFVSNGIISGLEGVIIFVPQIFILFFLIGILEDSGYMVRASFLTDRIMRKLGLNGRSIIPLVGGFACAIPSIMATRNIRNKTERLVTMLIVPLMSCSARLPVYILLISLVVPVGVFWGPFHAQTVLMTSAYFAGIFVAIIMAIVLKIFLKNKETSEFVLELPTYQAPRLQTVLNNAWIKCKSFLGEAGKVIIIISMVLWALSNYGPSNAMLNAEKLAQIETAQGNPDSLQIKNSLKLEASYAGHLGKFIEPAIRPLGYDWKTGIALISSFAAREVFVGTMSTLFQSNEEEDVVGIRQKMQAQINPSTGDSQYTPAYAISLMLFYAFALQCVSTVAVLKKETGTWKWSIILFLLYGFIAYFSAFIAYQTLS
jgi:ferrous iron transport protein B